MKSIGLYKYSVSYSEHLFKLYGYNYDAGFALNIVFFFFQEISIFYDLSFARTRLLLVEQKMASQ